MVFIRLRTILAPLTCYQSRNDFKAQSTRIRMFWNALFFFFLSFRFSVHKTITKTQLWKTLSRVKDRFPLLMTRDGLVIVGGSAAFYLKGTYLVMTLLLLPTSELSSASDSSSGSSITSSLVAFTGNSESTSSSSFSSSSTNQGIPLGSNEGFFPPCGA